VTLFVVRHGESEGNARRIIQGWLDVPLTERGHAQAAAAARRLAPEPVTAVYSSTLQRAKQTAEAIATPHGLEVTALVGLREYNYGEAQGLNWGEVQERWPHDAEQWGLGHVPGEEGVEAFRRRVAATFETLAERHRSEDAVLVCHGGTIVQLVAHILGLPPRVRPRIYHANCAITTVATAGERPALLSLNDWCHVAALEGRE
jgi:broad specificity phosphatase PhoE